MSNIYEVFNIKNDTDLSTLLNKLDLDNNNFMNVIAITESYDDLSTKRQRILELMAGTKDANYDICLEYFNKKNQRMLKEGATKLGLNQIMEINALIELVASKLACPNCMEGIYNIITSKATPEIANIFLSNVQQAPNSNAELKFDIDAVANGQDVYQTIYQLKNDIELFANNLKVEKAKENVNESVLIETNSIVSDVQNQIDSANDLQSINKLISQINYLIKNSESTDDQNTFASLKSDALTKLSQINHQTGEIQECCSMIPNEICDDNFNQILGSLKPTFVSITVNKDNGEICDNECSCDCQDCQCQPVEQPSNPSNYNLVQTVNNVNPTATDLPILCKPNNAEATSALTALSGHLNCVKSDSRENNIQELETINNLLNSLSNYFNGVLKEEAEGLSVQNHIAGVYDINSNTFSELNRGEEHNLSLAKNVNNFTSEEIHNELQETCSCGATCAANVSGFAKPLGSKKKKKKETPDYSLFKEYVSESIPSELSINNHKVSYKIYEGVDYLYIDNGILGTTNKQQILEAIDELYNENKTSIEVFEGFNYLDLQYLMEDINAANGTNMSNNSSDNNEDDDMTDVEKNKFENTLVSNPTAKISITDNDNPNTVDSNQEFVGIDDSDPQNKKYIVKDKSNGKVRSVNLSDIHLEGDL